VCDDGILIINTLIDFFNIIHHPVFYLTQRFIDWIKKISKCIKIHELKPTQLLEMQLSS
jgi:hypothetical protein